MLKRISVLINLEGRVGQDFFIWSYVNQNFKWLLRVDHEFFSSLYIFSFFDRVNWCNDVIAIIMDRYNCLTKK